MTARIRVAVGAAVVLLVCVGGLTAGPAAGPDSDPGEQQGSDGSLHVPPRCGEECSRVRVLST